MPKMIISIDGSIAREVPLTKDRTTLGRRPYNDIVIDNPAVSGEHAVVHRSGSEVFLEDLNSTNGSYVNGQSVRKQLLQHGDRIEIGKCSIRFEQGDEATDQHGHMPMATAMGSPPGLVSGEGDRAYLKVLSGAAAGRELQMVKTVTTVGQPGVVIATITRHPGAYTLSLVEGRPLPTVNGVPVQGDSIELRHGDLIEMAGSQLQFIRS